MVYQVSKSSQVTVALAKGVSESIGSSDRSEELLLQDIKKLYACGCRQVQETILGLGDSTPAHTLTKLHTTPLAKIEGRYKLIRAIVKTEAVFVELYCFKCAVQGTKPTSEIVDGIKVFTSDLASYLPEHCRESNSLVQVNSDALNRLSMTQTIADRLGSVDSLSRKMEMIRNTYAVNFRVIDTFFVHLLGERAKKRDPYASLCLRWVLFSKPSEEQFERHFAKTLMAQHEKNESSAIAILRVCMDIVQNKDLSTSLRRSIVSHEKFGITCVLRSSPYPSVRLLAVKYLKRLASKPAYSAFRSISLFALNSHYLKLCERDSTSIEEREYLEHALDGLGVSCRQLLESRDPSFLPHLPAMQGRYAEVVDRLEIRAPTKEDFKEAFAECKRGVEKEEFESAMTPFVCAVSFVTPTTSLADVASLMSLFVRVAPHISPQTLTAQMVYAQGTFTHTVMQFPQLVNKQFFLALAVGGAYRQHKKFLSSMSYYAIAIQIGKERLPNRLKEAHYQASKTFFCAIREFLIDKETFREVLKELDPASFTHTLGYFEGLRAFCTDREDEQVIIETFHVAEDVIASMPPISRKKFSFLLPRIADSKKSQIEDQREFFVTESLQKTLLEFRQKYEAEFAKHTDLRAFQKQQSEAFKRLVEEEFCKRIFLLLTHKPCSFDFLAMGSVAREELCPFSDLEWVLLVENQRNKEYFRTFHMFLSLLMTSLGETPPDRDLPIFTSLSSPMRSGLHLDNGDVVDMLITNPVFPKAKADESDLDPRMLAHTLMNVTSIHADGDELLPKLRVSKQNTLNAPVRAGEGLTVRRNRAQILFSVRIDDYHTMLRRVQLDLEEQGQEVIDVKEQFVQPLFYLLGDLALYYGLEETNTLDIVDALVEAFDESSRALIKDVLSGIFRIRVRLHLAYDRQCEIVSVEPIENIIQLKIEERFALRKARDLVIAPLYAHLEKWMETDRIDPPFQGVDLPRIAFMESILSFCEDSNIEKASRFIESFKYYIGDCLDQQQIYFRMLSTDTRLERMREVFVRGLPENSPLLNVPNCDGFRQSFRVGYEHLDAMLERITTNQSPEEGMKVEVIGMRGEGKRYLKSEITCDLFDDSGHVRKLYPSSAHSVMHLQGEGFDLHCKEMPTQPSMEYAVHSFTWRLIGAGSTPSRLVKLKINDQSYRPVLFSKTVPGTVLTERWDRPICQRSLTWMLIRAVLLKPGDERGSNLIGDGRGCITCIDNDVALVEPIVKTGLMKSKVSFKTLLPFLSDHPLDQDVIEDFLKIAPELFLHGWLNDLMHVERQYDSLFKPAELVDLYKKGEELSFTPSILFRKGAVASLYTQWVFLQELFRNRTQVLYPLDLIKSIVTLDGINQGKNEVGLKLYRSYDRAKRLKLCPKDQLLKVTEEKTDQSVTNLEAMRASIGRTPTLTEVINREEFGPEKAVEELQLFMFKTYDAMLEVTIGQGSAHLRADFSRIQIHGQPDLERQRLLMRGLRCHHNLRGFQQITLLNAPTLSNEELKSFFHHGLKSLTLVNCSEVTSKVLAVLASTSPGLKELAVENCSGLVRINDGTIIGNGEICFPSLQKLQISYCQALEDVKMFAPHLQSCKFDLNPQLFNYSLDDLREPIFGRSSWEKYFGSIDEEPPLPPNIDKILNQPDPVLLLTKVRDSHVLTLIPTKVNGQPFNLDYLSELIQSPHSWGHAAKFRRYDQKVQDRFGDETPQRPYWVLMRKTQNAVIQYSDGAVDNREARDEIKKLSAKLGYTYDFPCLLEAATSISMHYIRGGENLLHRTPFMNYTYCKEQIGPRGEHVALGDFFDGGFCIRARKPFFSLAGYTPVCRF